MKMRQLLNARTVRNARLPALLAVVVAVIAASAAQVLSAGSDGQAAGTPLPVSADAGPAGVTLTPLLAGPGMVSEAAALAIAARVAPVDRANGKIEAFLVVAHDPTIVDQALNARPIWLVHLSGSYPISVPFGLKNPGPASVGNGYIYIDAYSGEWLLSRFED